MFDGPAYASYRQLCRDLHRTIWREGRKVRPRLMPELDLVPGDWRLDDRDDVNLVTEQMRNAHDVVLLPRLDQWLAMLEEAGVEYVEIGVAWIAPEGVLAELTAAGEATKTYYAYDAINQPDTDEKTEFPSREEAAARLWCAVTGRLVSG